MLIVYYILSNYILFILINLALVINQNTLFLVLRNKLIYEFVLRYIKIVIF